MSRLAELFGTITGVYVPYLEANAVARLATSSPRQAPDVIPSLPIAPSGRSSPVVSASDAQHKSLA